MNGTEIMTCHLDPDIESGLFGQCSAAAQHLINNNVKVGDLLLFFGWFREFDIKTHKFCTQDKMGKHCIYAYFKIGRILDLNNSQDREEEALQLTKTHPHIAYKSTEYEKTNLLFVADTKLLEDSDIRGCGRLKFSESTLIKANENKSIWLLPKCFLNTNMTYHTNKNRWTDLNSEYCQVKSVYRGQEFVISENKNVEQWAIELITNNLLHL